MQDQGRSPLRQAGPVSDARLPTVFVGSSTEGIDICRNLQVELESSRTCDVELWSHIFKPSQFSLEALIEIAERVDFAVLVATADDTIESRGTSSASPRDNVILELGLFVGALGRDRTYLLTDASTRLKLPSDLLGLTYIPYYPRPGGNERAAVGAASTQVLERVKARGRRDRETPNRRLATSAQPRPGTPSQPSEAARLSEEGVLVREIDRVCSDAIAQGWQVKKRSDTTLRLRSPRGVVKTFQMLPAASSRSRLRKFVNELRAGGLRINSSVRTSVGPPNP